MKTTQTFDVAVIGSGVGGGATALRLAPSGLSVAIVERGPLLPREPQNWDPDAVFNGRRYVDRSELWSFDGRRPEQPLAYYYVGGATKLYGGVMVRLRERDFAETVYPDGVSPAWPLRYADLEPYYEEAEALFGVHGSAGGDPTEPPRRVPLPFGPIDHDPTIETLTRRLRDRGLHPFHLPLAIERHAGGRCVRCATCDGFPCRVDAKADAEIALIRPALAHPNVTLFDNALVTRLELSGDGRRIDRIVGARNGEAFSLRAKVFVLAAGAINSAALLLRSAQGRFARGLANGSDVVGRHYMAHNSSVVMAFGPRKTNITFQKTFGLNDFYFGDADYPLPMGNIQMIGKIQGPMLKQRARFLTAGLRQAAADRSIDWYAQSEDLPHPDSRVTVDTDGRIRLDRRPTNVRSHHELLRRTTAIMRSLGFPIVVTETLGIRTTSHQCGTVRMGDDPARAALDPLCRSYDHPNLLVVDGSFFPSSAAVNPSLTIAAQALRVADHILRADFGATPKSESNPACAPSRSSSTAPTAPARSSA